MEKMMRTGWKLMIAGSLLAGLAGCGDPPPLYVDGGYVRLNANPAAPSAAYFTIHGGADPVTLRGISTDEAVRAEIHESMTQGGMASMKKVDTIDIPAKGTVKFEPGGRHIMLWNVNPQALADGKISMTFIFSNGDRIIADAIVQKPDGAPAAAGNAMSNDMASNGMSMDHMGH